MEISTALVEATAALNDAGVDTARLDAELLMAHILGVARLDLLLQGDQNITQTQTRAFEVLLARRCSREPMAHILGVREFWSLDFAVNEHTLVPRPDSETLVEAVLKFASEQAQSTPLHILDLGTGSGCLLLSILSQLTDANGVGIDISAGAIEMAEKNARSLGLTERAAFQQFDYMNAAQDASWGGFDIIISNPPYIESGDIATLAEEVRGFDPAAALDGGPDGLDHYRRLVDVTRDWLRPGGRVFLEVGAGQAESVGGLLVKNGWRELAVFNDLAGVERIVSAVY